MSTYQDRWIAGRSVAPGYRECAERYAIVKKFCDVFDGPFSVCDVGANMCYFGLRLTEDFPQCFVTAFEFHQFKMRAAHLRKCKADRILLLNHKLNLADLAVLGAACQFDLVLALSVVHHISGPVNAVLDGLRGLGKNLIVEFAMNDSKRAGDRYRVPDDGVILGYGNSHLRKGAQRPIVLMRGVRE